MTLTSIPSMYQRRLMALSAGYDRLWNSYQYYLALVQDLENLGGLPEDVKKQRDKFKKRHRVVLDNVSSAFGELRYTLWQIDNAHEKVEALRGDLDPAIKDLQKTLDHRTAQQKEEELEQKWKNLKGLYSDYRNIRSMWLRNTAAQAPDPKGEIDKLFRLTKRAYETYKNNSQKVTYSEISQLIDELSKTLSRSIRQMNQKLHPDAGLPEVTILYNKYVNAVEQLTDEKPAEDDMMRMWYDRVMTKANNCKKRLGSANCDELPEEIKFLSQGLSRELQRLAKGQKLYNRFAKLGKLRERIENADENYFRKEIGKFKELQSELGRDKANLWKNEKRVEELTRSVNEQCRRVRESLELCLLNKVAILKSELRKTRDEFDTTTKLCLLNKMAILKMELRKTRDEFDTTTALATKRTLYLKMAKEALASGIDPIKEWNAKMEKLPLRESADPTLEDLEAETDKLIGALNDASNHIRQLTEEMKKECAVAKKQTLADVSQQLKAHRDEFEAVTAKLKGYDTDRRVFLLNAAEQTEISIAELTQDLEEENLWKDEKPGKEVLRSIELSCTMAQKWIREMAQESKAVRSLQEQLHADLGNLQSLNNKLQTTFSNFKILINLNDLNDDNVKKIASHLGEVGQTQEKIGVLLKECQGSDLWDDKLRMEDLLSRVTEETEQAQKWIGILEGKAEMPSSVAPTNNSTQASFGAVGMSGSLGLAKVL